MICKQVSKFKNCSITLPRIKLQTKPKITKKEVKNVKDCCSNCKLIVDNIENHYKESLICGQTKESIKVQEKHSTYVKESNKKQYKNSKPTKCKKEKVKCKSCLKEYFDINNHLSKAFSCQNAYGIEKALDDSFDKEIIIDDCNSPIPKSSLNFEQNQKIKTKCSNCLKLYTNILLHLKKSQTCQESYDMEDIERKHKEISKAKNKLRVQKHRNSIDEKQKEEEAMKHRKRMKELRNSKDEEQKAEEAMNDRKRKRESWNSMDDKQKAEEALNKRKRMKEFRKSMDDKQKAEEAMNKRERMKEFRNSMDDKQKAKEAMNNIKITKP